MTKRKKTPKSVREEVYIRQKGGCACCLEKAIECHHVNPVTLGGISSTKNLVYLCKEHHKLLHLADPETCMQVYEYIYYIHKGELPDDPYSLLTAEEVIELIKEDY